MGKLNVTLLRYLTQEDFRVLTGVEMGMKNHELVPGALVATIANLHHGGVHKILRDLCKSGLLSYERGKRFDGYRLTNKGYDYLALKALTSKGAIKSFGHQIGIGKESNIYIVANEQKESLCLKLHRLGRICFRNIREKRDYYGKRCKANWLYLSRIAAIKEFCYMKALKERGFPTPQPIEMNRHCIIMELVDGYPLNRVDEVPCVEDLYDDLMNLIERLATHGVIHGDFNEFNILVNRETAKPTIIDFPQMVSTNHANAKFYFDRDVDCVRSFFRRKFNFESLLYPKFEDVIRKDVLDLEIYASGTFTKQMAKDLLEGLSINDGEDDDDDEVNANETDTDEFETSDNVKIEDLKQMTEQSLKESIISDEIDELQNNVSNDSHFITMNDHFYNSLKIGASETIYEDDDVKSSGRLTSFGSISTTASTIPPEVIRARIKKVLEKKQKEMTGSKRVIVKGEASAVTRSRRENLATIKGSKDLVYEFN